MIHNHFQQFHMRPTQKASPYRKLNHTYVSLQQKHQRTDINYIFINFICSTHYLISKLIISKNVSICEIHKMSLWLLHKDFKRLNC